MTWREMWSRLRGPSDDEIQREVQLHLDLEAEGQRGMGYLPPQARDAARRAFGNTTLVQEDVRDVWGWGWIEARMQDLRYAFRGLRKAPAFTTVAVLSLAIGIGANTGVYSVLHALILRTLPVSDPSRLVVVTRNENISSPYPLFADLREHSQTLEGVLAFRTAVMRLGVNGQTERVTGALVSGTYFDVLGVRPLLGTTITKEDDQTLGSGGWRGPVAVLSHSFWLRRFGGRADVVGTRIVLNDHPFTLVGIAPEGFDGTETGEPAEVFAPMMMQREILPGLGMALNQPKSQWLRIFGRLRPGTDVREAEAELTTLLRRYNEEIIGNSNNLDAGRRRGLLAQKIVLLPGGTGISQLRRQYSKPLWVLTLVVALVLLMACGNVASLMLSRAASRRREIALRLSLGAPRSRLILQSFTESLLLAIAGAGSGLILARWMRDILVRYLPPDRSLNAPMEPAVLLFTLVVGVSAALVFGIFPALQGTSIDVAPTIKGGETAGKPARVAFRQGLVVFQISLSCLLLIAAALFLHSLRNLLMVDPGFARANVLVASVESAPGLDSRLLSAVKVLPGVTSAALADSPPLRFHTGWNVYIQGSSTAANEAHESPGVGFVSPGYFSTMGIPLLLGRDIDDRDVRGERSVMIVNETFARRYFTDENPIGRMVGNKEGVYEWEIVGLVKDGKYSGLREVAAAMIYVPAKPGPWASRTVVHLRTEGNPAALASALREKVHQLEKSAAVSDVRTVQDEMDRSLLPERLVGTVTGLFGGLALTLAITGLYGLISYGVARRTREFGIRMAIGAKAGSIVTLVVRGALWLLMAGVAIGTAAAWFFGRAVRAMLFGIEPADPLSTVGALLVLVAAAIVAAWIPARRAARVDPLVALRYE